MRRIIVFIIVLLVALLGLSFALMNAEPVKLNYYFATLEAPLSLVVVFAIALGSALGVLAVIGIVLGQKLEIAKLRKAVKMAEKEVSNLRALPLKDSH